MNTGGAIMPFWIAVLLAAVGMLLIGSYVLALQSDRVPPSRRRLRTAGGVVQMFLVGTIAYAAGLVPVADKRLFAMAWVLVMILTLVVIALAVLDIVNNLRIAALERRETTRLAAEKLAEELKLRLAAQAEIQRDRTEAGPGADRE